MGCIMTTIPFDVNNEKLREGFFNQLFMDCIKPLTEDTMPLWGKMSAQNMVEHLIWAFERSTSAVEMPCLTPVDLLERVKTTFLYENKPMSHDYKHPLLSKDPEPLLYNSLQEAKDALRKELGYFLYHFSAYPSAVHVHAVLGPLNAEEWQRCHFKHCYHHFLQFGLINQQN